jgi:uncharacterized protein (DUF58 family)
MSTRPRISVPPATWIYLLILAVVIVGSVMREINLLMILSGLMCGPLVINFHMAIATLRKTDVYRELPESVFAGEPFWVELTVVNDRERLDGWGLVVEDCLREVAGEGADSHEIQRVNSMVPFCSARGEQDTGYRVRLWRRGRYRLGPLTLSTRAPLGLLQGQVTFNYEQDLLVLPRLGQLTARWSALVAADRAGQRTSQRRQGPLEGDFFGLREWRSGDSQRMVHWRSSAKRGALVVRQFERPRGQNYLVLLDLGQRPTGSTGSRWTAEDECQVEQAIRFTATVLADLCQRGSGQIGLGVAGRKAVWRRSTASPVALREWLEILAEVEVGEQDAWFGLLPEVTAMMGSEDQPIVISVPPLDLADGQRFPDSPQDGSGRSWQRAIGVCVSRGDLESLFMDEQEAVPSLAVPPPHVPLHSSSQPRGTDLTR